MTLLLTSLFPFYLFCIMALRLASLFSFYLFCIIRSSENECEIIDNEASKNEKLRFLKLLEVPQWVGNDKGKLNVYGRIDRAIIGEVRPFYFS